MCSFSKSLGLAGWRIGFLACQASLADEILKIQDCSVISAARAGQEGLLAALPEIGEHVTLVRSALRERRDRLVAALHHAGLNEFLDPEGSLFLFLRLSGVKDSLAFCHRLLGEQHVVAVPGRAFGPGGESSIRLSFGSSASDHLEEAARRIATSIEGI